MGTRQEGLEPSDARAICRPAVGRTDGTRRETGKPIAAALGCAARAQVRARSKANLSPDAGSISSGFGVNLGFIWRCCGVDLKPRWGRVAVMRRLRVDQGRSKVDVTSTEGRSNVDSGPIRSRAWGRVGLCFGIGSMDCVQLGWDARLLASGESSVMGLRVGVRGNDRPTEREIDPGGGVGRAWVELRWLRSRFRSRPWVDPRPS